MDHFFYYLSMLNNNFKEIMNCKNAIGQRHINNLNCYCILSRVKSDKLQTKW